MKELFERLEEFGDLGIILFFVIRFLLSRRKRSRQPTPVPTPPRPRPVVVTEAQREEVRDAIHRALDHAPDIAPNAQVLVPHVAPPVPEPVELDLKQFARVRPVPKTKVPTASANRVVQAIVLREVMTGPRTQRI